MHLAAANNRRAVIEMLILAGANMYLCVQLVPGHASYHTPGLTADLLTRALHFVGHAATAVTCTSVPHCTTPPTPGTWRS